MQSCTSLFLGVRYAAVVDSQCWNTHDLQTYESVRDDHDLPYHADWRVYISYWFNSWGLFQMIVGLRSGWGARKQDAKQQIDVVIISRLFLRYMISALPLEHSRLIDIVQEWVKLEVVVEDGLDAGLKAQISLCPLMGPLGCLSLVRGDRTNISGSIYIL